MRKTQRLADHKLDTNLQRKEAVENPNAILGSINRTAECGGRKAIIPERAGRSGHMQFYAQSCRLYFKRGTDKFKPVQKSRKRVGHQYLHSIRDQLDSPFTIGTLRMIIALKTQNLSSQCQESHFQCLLNFLELCSGSSL